MRNKQEWVAKKKDTPTRSKCAENQKKLDTVIKNGRASEIFKVKILCEGVLNAIRAQRNSTQATIEREKETAKHSAHTHTLWMHKNI